jgi:hypothetical protein
VDDRVACFTIIDDHWADTVQRMQMKNLKNGYGLFKYQTVNETKVITLPNMQTQEITHSKQEHVYSSNRVRSKEEMIKSNKQLSEKVTINDLTIF